MKGGPGGIVEVEAYSREDCWTSVVDLILQFRVLWSGGSWLERLA